MKIEEVGGFWVNLILGGVLSDWIEGLESGSEVSQIDMNNITSKQHVYKNNRLLK